MVIGAMVIAPLLGPNIALALGAALGDMPLMWKAFKTMVTGIGLALFLSICVGFFHPMNLDSPELMARTDVGIGFDCLGISFWCSCSAFFDNGTFQCAGRGDGSGCVIASHCYSWNHAGCGSWSACNWCSHIACGKYCLRESGGKNGVSVKRHLNLGAG